VSRLPAALTGLALACAPALHTHPGATAPTSGPVAEPTRSAEELLADARARFGRRSEPGQARAAEALFRQAAQADPTDPAAPYGAIQALIWRIDHDPGVDRGALASDAVGLGLGCLERAPAQPSCDYGLALALGVQARERRSTAVDGLRKMVQHLRRAAEAEPGLDASGPDRVLATVLVRAPGWPLGPGDPEGGLERARLAAQRAPDFPPNQLALAEALLATGATAAGQETARRAVALARAHPEEPEAPAWIAEGERLLMRPASPGA